MNDNPGGGCLGVIIWLIVVSVIVGSCMSITGIGA